MQRKLWKRVGEALFLGHQQRRRVVCSMMMMVMTAACLLLSHLHHLSPDYRQTHWDRARRNRCLAGQLKEIVSLAMMGTRWDTQTQSPDLLLQSLPFHKILTKGTLRCEDQC